MSTITHEKLKVISPIENLTVMGLSLSQRPGEHGFVRLQGIAENGILSASEVQAMKGQRLHIAALNDNGKEDRRPIFNGIITNAQTENANALCRVVIEAGTGSIALDSAPKSRSFQDINMTYEDIVDIVLNDTPNADAVYSVGRGVPIGKPLIQYQETDWAFIKRLASHFNAPIIPDNMTGDPSVWFGLPQRKEGFTFTGTEYSLRVGKAFFEMGGSAAGLEKSNFIYYNIHDAKNRRIGDTITIGQRPYIICAKSAELVKGELIFRYKAGAPMTAAVPKQYNDNFTGLSLIGNVTKTTKETVELALEIDKGKPHGSYPYTWAPATGNLAYCMPQVGTKASLYIPKRDEQAAFVNASVRENGDSCPTTSDPQFRGLVTEHGKHLDLFPENLSLSNGGAIAVNLDDMTGVSLSGDKKVLMIAKGSIRFTAPNIHVQAPFSLKFYQDGSCAAEIESLFGSGNPSTGGISGGAALEITDIFQTVGSDGSLVRGWDYKSFGDFDDAPTVGQYSARKSIWKAIVCVAAVLVVAVVVAAVTVATAGVGTAAMAIGIGAALGIGIGGTAAAVGTMVSDLVNGVNSSRETYIAKTLPELSPGQLWAPRPDGWGQRGLRPACLHTRGLLE